MKASLFILMAIFLPYFAFGNQQQANVAVTMMNNNNRGLQLQLSRRIQQYRQMSQLENLRAKGNNGKTMKVLLPKLVFWRKKRQEQIQRQRMQQCIKVLNEQICNNRGSFYQWGKIIAQRIRNGDFQSSPSPSLPSNLPRSFVVVQG